MCNFSILQAVYKNDSTSGLNECFKSLLNQTIPPTRIILVKDGELNSEMNSLIDNWKEKLPLFVVGYSENKGLAHALNYGLQYVETDLVARMDSDDICFKDRFEKQLDFFNKHLDCEICGTGISEFYIDKTNKEHRTIRLYPEVTTCKSKTLYKGTPLAHPTVMMRTDLLKKYCYSENTNMNEDIDLWFRLIFDGHKIYSIQEPLLNFRITDGTFRRRSKAKAFSEYKIYTRNLYALFGLSPLIIYPVLRLFVRFLPYRINKQLYFSKKRASLYKSHNN